LCGSLKWLFDYENLVESELKKQIESLNLEVFELIKQSKASNDWINEQFELIQKRQELAQLQKYSDRLNNYNKKIDDIRKQIQEESKRKFKNRPLKNEEKLLDVEEETEELADEETDDFGIQNESSDEEFEEETDEEKYSNIKIYFCSRTHSQLNQIVNEVKNTIYQKDLRSVSLASRQNYCINESVKSLKNSNLINERCLELQKNKSKTTKNDEDSNPVKKRMLGNQKCPFYKDKEEKLRNYSISKVLDIEELIGIAKEEKSCPYYSTRSAAKDCQLIMVPYQILFNKTTREQCGIDLKNNIVIIDEAHNLLDTISQIHTASISLKFLKVSHRQLIDYKMKYVRRFSAKNLLKFNQLIFVTKQLVKYLEKSSADSKILHLHELLSDCEIYNINLQEILKFCDKTRFAPKIHGFSRKHQKDLLELKKQEELKKNSTKILLQQIQQEQQKKKNQKKEEPVVQEDVKEEPEQLPNVIRVLLQFLDCLTQKYDDGRILVSSDGTENSTLKYLLLNPSSPFQEIIQDCRSIILAGGTMEPTFEFTEQLFKKCQNRVEIHCFGHVVPKESILPLALSHGCSNKEFLFTFQQKENLEMLKEVSLTIQNICSIVPGGVVCFFTSYDNLNRFYGFIEEQGIFKTIQKKKVVFKEPRVAGKLEKILEDYARVIKDSKRLAGEKTGALMLSVIGGKLSEGMNFSDDLGRCVIVVGLPYPNKFNRELTEKMNYLNSTVSPGAGNEYYENLCMKAVNQSIGRAIRHIGDYATVVLLDKRYQQPKIVDKLPQWIRNNLQVCTSYGKAHAQIAKFFKDK
jgi:chromosome transmission fidelity protein 1